MTIFAGDAPALDRRTILDVPAETGEVFDASFDQAFSTNPSTSLYRSEELAQQNEGRAVVMGPESYLAPNAGRLDPESPMVTAQDARDRVDSLGLKIQIPEQGVRQGALDVLIQRHQEQAARQQVIARGGSSFGTQLAGGLAASIFDPLNVAAAFVPVVGPARYAALVEGASGALGRAGVRAGVGALEGSVGAAILEPFPQIAASQDQTDYTMYDSLANIAFGAILGGGLHTVGGAISDRMKSRIANEDDVSPVVQNSGDAPPAPAGPDTALRLDAFDRAFDDDPIVALRRTLARQLEEDQATLRVGAEQRAIEEIIPTLSGERVGNVADLRIERAGLDRQLEDLDGSYRDRAKQFQREGQSRKQAESSARKAIASERESLQSRAAEIDETLSGNRQNEMNRADIASLQRGVIPDHLKERVAARTDELMQGYQQRPLGPALRTAREQAEQADWTIRANALRTAVAQSMSGREVDVQHIFDLQDPAKRAGAMDALRREPRRADDPSGQSSSARADQLVRSERDELTQAREDLAAEESMINDILAQLPEADRLAVENAARAETDAAAQLAAKADQYSKAYRAAAICDIRNGI